MPDGIRGRPFEMSRFHCRELLYDYMRGQLDQQRVEAVEKILREDQELKAELDAYIDAAHYCEKLALVRLSENTIDELENIRLQSEIIAEKVRYRNWPDLLKWSSEAVVISVFVAGMAMVIPWASLRSIFKNPSRNEVILADIEKVPEKGTTPIPDKPAPIGAKIKPEAPKVETKAPPLAAVPIVPPGQTPTAAVVKPPEPMVLAQAPRPLPPPEPTKPRLVEKQVGTQSSIKPAVRGELYRIMMNKSNIAKLAPDLRAKIIALGGKKAGEVEIGWRQPGQNYFHFSIPKANYDQLLAILATLGPSRVYKSPHNRVMPEGIMRIILTIKDGPSGSSKKDEEPTADETEVVPAAPAVEAPTAPATSPTEGSTGSDQ